MREQISKFADEVHDQFDSLQARLKRLKSTIMVESTDTRQALRAHLESLDDRIAKQSKKVKHAAEEVEDKVEDWADEHLETVNIWRKARQYDKLQARAEKAEAYAKARMEMATRAFEKAERAAVQAALARAEARSDDDEFDNDLDDDD
jgi:flagellar biosynthesis chaperone FliJ